MKIKKLLFVTKFDSLCFDALRSLLDLRNAALSDVVFMNVIERDRVAMRRGAGYQKEEEIRLRELANIRFIDWAETLFEQGMEVGVYIVVGSLVPEVIKATEKEQADLIVIGQSPKRVFESLYAGSDITELLRRTTAPVLVYKHLTEDPSDLERPFRRPLVATDWSPASLRSIEYLKGLGKVVERIDIINVADEKDLKGTSAMAVQKTRKEIRTKLDALCADFEQKGIDAKAHVYVGDPDLEIDKAARECQATMIVLGSSGKAAWRERWLGSTPRRISEDSVYPVLLVPPLKA